MELKNLFKNTITALGEFEWFVIGAVNFIIISFLIILILIYGTKETYPNIEDDKKRRNN